jgi:hypothetical protein
MPARHPLDATDWAPVGRSRRLAWVTLGHALLLWGWLTALEHAQVTLSPSPGAGSVLRLWPTSRPVRAPQAANQPPAATTGRTPSHPSRRPTPAAPRPTAQALVLLPQLPAPSSAAEPGEAPRPTTATPLLQTEASRRVLRDLARQPVLSERAASATDQAPVIAGQQLSRQLGASLHGDCDKGQFTGAGMGLLSLPFLAGAKLTGQCAQ